MSNAQKLSQAVAGGANPVKTNVTQTWTAQQTFNSETTIASAGTGTTLKITNTGTGNSFVVEDSASPDSTPFVIDANGRVLIGTATSTAGTGGLVDGLQITNAGTASQNYNANQFGNRIQFAKSRSATLGVHTVVNNADTLGYLQWAGSDGAAFIEAARIVAEVDGTPGTNDMPGRLVFSVTRDGASSPTEAMRIDSAGNVGIGGTATAFAKVQITGTLPSSSNYSYGFDSSGVAPSSSTTGYFLFSSAASTQAATFTLYNLTHYNTYQGAIGAGSSVTNQYGFSASSTLTGATNNFGFYSNIASGTGRWNFYAAGTARNYFAGGVEVAAGSTSMTSGFTHIPAAAGAPSGAPTNPTGNVPMYYDTTNNRLYVYNGAWKYVALA